MSQDYFMSYKDPSLLQRGKETVRNLYYGNYNTPVVSKEEVSITKNPYDPSQPIWMQEPNPNIPWGVNNPYRKKAIEIGLQTYDKLEMGALLRFLDTKYGGFVDEDTWLEENK
jgi:hypothetical protein